MRLLPLSAFPLLAFLGLLDLGQARQGNKPRDKLQLRAKPRAQEVSTDICDDPLTNSWSSECPSVFCRQQSADRHPAHGKVTPLAFFFSILVSDDLQCEE